MRDVSFATIYIYISNNNVLTYSLVLTIPDGFYILKCNTAPCWWEQLFWKHRCFYNVKSINVMKLNYVDQKKYINIFDNNAII